MKLLEYKNNKLFFDNIDLYDFSCNSTTPFYIYSETVIKDNINEYLSSTKDDVLFCYSIKANSNLNILKLISSLGLGFDVVSGGELFKALEAGGTPKKIVFSGVGKSSEEIEYALDSSILCFNVESIGELKLINTLAARKNIKADVSIRVNPDISVNTHPYISTGMKNNKFGIPFDEALDVYKTAMNLDSLNIVGIDFHIGSQITSTKPYIDSVRSIKKLINQLKSLDIKLEHIDVGGGVGIKYQNETTINKSKYVKHILDELRDLNLKIIFEPGRSIIGDAGLLVTKAQYIKESEFKNFLVVDASMSELIRPPLYNAYHKITPILKNKSKGKKYDVVGPVCESADFLGLERDLCVGIGDYLVVENVGAYGFVLASNYNTRPKPAEYLIASSKIQQIRKRESIKQIIENETDL